MNNDLETIYSNITSAINFQTKNSPAFEQLIKFQLSILNDLVLPDPFESSTPDFIDNFSVKIIKNILNTAVSDSSIITTFSTILENYSRILIFIFDQPNLSFLEAATQITNPTNIFYTAISKRNPPKIYNKILNLFQTKHFYEQITNFFEKNDSIPLKHVSILINLLISTKEKTEIYCNSINFIFQKTISIFRSYNYDDLREIDDKLMNSTLDSIYSLEQSYLSTTFSLDFQIEKNILFSKSDILEKRFNGINKIATIISKESSNKQNQILKIVNDQKILNSILNDFHHQLVNPFVSILSQFIQNKFDVQSYLVAFWKVSVNQNSSLAPEFSSGWKKLIFSDIKIKKIILSQYSNALFDEISIASNFPESFFSFLDEISTYANEKQKEQVFTSLLIFASNQSSEISIGLMNTALNYMPKNDEQIVKESLEMIENDFHIKFAISLISNLKLNSNYLNSLIKVLNRKNSMDVIDLLWKLLDRFGNSLDENQLLKIIEIYLTFLNSDSEKVVTFFINATSKSIFSIELKKELFKRVCQFEIEFKDSFIPLILHLFKSINVENKVKENGIELLWELTYRTKNENLIIFLNSQIGTLNFVDFCMKNIRNPGSLESLNIIVKIVENNMNNHVRSVLNLPLINQYIDDDFLFNVKIVGYIETILKVTKNTNFSALKFYLSLLTKINMNNLVLYLNGSIITNFDDQINSEITVEVKPKSSSGISFKFDVESEMPSLILFSNATYTMNLMNLIEDEEFGHNALKILNEMPLVHNFSINFDSEENDQNDKSNEFRNCSRDWNCFLSFSNPNHLIYRLNTIGNYLNENDRNWIESFFKTGGAFRLIELLLKLENNYNNNDFLLLLLLLVKKLFLLNLDEEMSQIILQKVDSKEFSNFLNCSLKLFTNDDISYNLLFVIERITLIRGMPKENVNFYVELFGLTCFHSNKKITKLANDFLLKKEIESITIMIQLLPKAINTNNSEFVNSILSLITSQSTEKEMIWNSLLDSTFEYFSPLKNKDVEGIWKNLNKSYPQDDFIQTLLSSFMHMIGLFNCIENKILEIPRIDELYFFLFDEILYNQIVYFKISPKLINLLNQIICIKPSLVHETIERIKKIQSEMKTLKTNEKTTIQNNTNKGSDDHIKGLKNLGATCYMASILQQLYSIPILRSSLLNLDCEENDKNKWLIELQYLFLKLLIYPTSSSFIDPSNFVKEWKGPDENLINPRQQQDAEEHLSLILSRLEPNLKTIDSLFQGQIKNHVQGEGENKQYERDFIENFFDISLEVKGYKNIDASFEAFKSPDIFEGKNKFNTDEFGPIDALQTHLILNASPILIFTLKRIQFNMNTFMKEKVNSRYEFPLNLDISPILADQKSSIYELYGVIIHKGTADAGHYISHIRDKMNNWRVFNDSNVHVETVDEMIKNSYGGNDSAVKFGSGSAYILFYRKVGYDFECKSGFDKGSLPVSSRLIERIACEIKKEILTEISLSKEYFMFIASIIQDVEILISLLSPKSGISKDCIDVIMNICIDKCKSKEFNDSILSFYTNAAFKYIENENNSNDLITNESLIKLVKESLFESTDSANDFMNKLIQKIQEIDQISDEKLEVYSKNLNLFYELVGEKIDHSKSVDVLIDYVSKNKNRNIGSIISLLFKMEKNNKGISNLTNFFTDEILLNYLVNNDSKEFLSLFIRRIKEKPSKIEIIFGLDPKDLKNSSVYGKIFICILASKLIKPENSSLFKESPNYMDFFFSNYLRSQKKEEITAIFEYVSSIISDFIDDTFDNFVYYSDIFIDKLLFSFSFEVRKAVYSLFLKFILSKISDIDSFTRSLFNIYTLLIKRIDRLQQCCTSKISEKGMNYEKLKSTLQVEEYFNLLTNVVLNGHFNNNVLSLNEKLAEFLNATAVSFVKFKEPCFIRKSVVDFITSTITKENSTKFFGSQGEILKNFLRGIPIFSQSYSYGKQEKNELETYSDSYIKFILLIPVQLFHNIANTYFLCEILQSTKYMQNQLSYELYKLICNYLNIQDNYVVSNFANIFFFYCLNCHLETGRKIPLKIGIFLFKKNPELTEIFYNNNFYQNVWSLIYEKISEYTVQKTKNRIPVDSSVFPLMHLLGVFISQFSSVPENKIESHWSKSKYYYLSSYFQKYSVNPSIILQFSLYENEASNLNDIFNSKGSFVFLESLFTLDAFSECEEIYIATLSFLQTRKGFINNVPKKSKLAATKFLITVLHWAKKTVSTLSNGPYAVIICNELSRFISSIYKRDTSQNFNQFKIERKIDFEILNLFAKEVSLYYFYADNQSIQEILGAFKKLMSYPEGVLYFNSKELTEVCLNVLKKNNVQPIEWIKNIQKFVLNLINDNQYSEDLVDDFVNAAKIVDDLMILFDIKEIPRIQMDEKSKSNQEQWAQIAQNRKGEKDEFVLTHLFTILVSNDQ